MYCSDCKKHFDGNAIEAHNNSKYKDWCHECNICGWKFRWNTELADHEEDHKEETHKG